MATPITTTPPEGTFVNVTDKGVTTRAAYWFGRWREFLSDASHLEFSEEAAWENLPNLVVPPEPVAPVAETPAAAPAEAK